MTKFLIAATDKQTNATVYARTSPTGRIVAFRNGIGGNYDPVARMSGLNVLRERGTELDADTACALLVSESQRIAELGDATWVRDLRIVTA